MTVRTVGQRRGPRRRPLLAACVFVTFATACGAGDGATSASGADEPLVVGLIPNIAPDEQQVRYEPFGAHLAEQLDREVELFVASDYAGVVTAMASGLVDVAYLGGVTYVQAEQQVEVVPLVTEIDQETGTWEYVSSIVVPADADAQDLDDVLAGGGTFAMGDVASTSGSLYPRMMLIDAGADCDAVQLTSCPPFDRITFTGGHDAAALAVLSGRADAAGLERRILARLVREGTVPEGALRSVAERRVPGYPWVARAALPADVRDAVVEAFLAIDDLDLLDLLRADGYVPVAAADYDQLRTAAHELGLVEPADGAS
jgi:phosphonate transport system substrate-binding protein